MSNACVNCKTKLQLVAIDHTLDFLKSCADYEQYATVYSKTMTELQKKEINPSSVNTENDPKTNCIEDTPLNSNDKKQFDTIDRYVKICYKGKSVYRKCCAKNGIKATEIGLGDRTQKEFGIDKCSAALVCVKASSFICYYLCNSDKYIKHTARIGLLGFLLTFLSGIIALFSLLVKYPLFHFS